jgi:hypothetical protein
MLEVTATRLSTYCSVAAPRDLAQTMMRGRTAQGRVRTDIKLLRWRDGWEPVNAPGLPVATALTEFALREPDKQAHLPEWREGPRSRTKS